jgi:hypothetical protein
MSNDRDPQTGRFAPGNPGAPGRTRRAIERDYLAALSEACPVARWRTIVERAVADAERGDPKAREWLSGHLIGRPSGVALLKLAASEQSGVDPVEVEADDLRNKDILLPLWKQLAGAGV